MALPSVMQSNIFAERDFDCAKVDRQNLIIFKQVAKVYCYLPKRILFFSFSFVKLARLPFVSGNLCRYLKNDIKGILLRNSFDCVAPR